MKKQKTRFIMVLFTLLMVMVSTVPVSAAAKKMGVLQNDMKS